MLKKFNFINLYLLLQYMCIYYNSIIPRIILCLVLIISIYYDMFVFSSQNAYIDTRHFTARGKQ